MRNRMEFGQRFRLCRKMAGYDSLSKASEATGLSKGALSDYENDKRTPLAPAIIAMSWAYGVTTDFLLGESDEQPKGWA